MIELNNINDQIIFSNLNLLEKAIQAISESKDKDFTNISLEMIQNSLFHSKEYHAEIKSAIENVCWEISGPNCNRKNIAEDFSRQITKSSKKYMN